MHVENPADKTQRKLKTWFEATQGTYGTFSFSGDTLQWTVSDIARPNTAAWLVCAGDQLFVNTGAFLYQTPEGCSDQTVSALSRLLETAFALRGVLTGDGRFIRMAAQRRMSECQGGKRKGYSYRGRTTHLHTYLNYGPKFKKSLDCINTCLVSTRLRVTRSSNPGLARQQAAWKTEGSMTATAITTSITAMKTTTEMVLPVPVQANAGCKQ